MCVFMWWKTNDISYLLCFEGYIGVFFFKQKTAYEMRISDWSSDVCSSDLDMRYYGGLRKRIPVTFWAMVAGTLAITGVVEACRDEIGRASCRERVCQYV